MTYDDTTTTNIDTTPMTYDDVLKLFMKCDVNASLPENLERCCLYAVDSRYPSSYPTIYLYDTEKRKKVSVPLRQVIFKLYTGIPVARRRHIATSCGAINCVNYLHYVFTNPAMRQSHALVSTDIRSVERSDLEDYVPNEYADIALNPVPIYVQYRFFAIGARRETKTYAENDISDLASPSVSQPYSAEFLESFKTTPEDLRMMLRPDRRD